LEAGLPTLPIMLPSLDPFIFDPMREAIMLL